MENLVNTHLPLLKSGLRAVRFILHHYNIFYIWYPLGALLIIILQSAMVVRIAVGFYRNLAPANDDIDLIFKVS